MTKEQELAIDQKLAIIRNLVHKLNQVGIEPELAFDLVLRSMIQN